MGFELSFRGCLSRIFVSLVFTSEEIPFPCKGLSADFTDGVLPFCH